MAPSADTAITDNVHFAQTDLVNWTLVTDDTGVMLIDAGFPGDRDDVLASLRQLGFGVDDVRAILLTHAHIDHFGSAIWFAENPWHTGVLPRRRGGPRQARVPGAGVARRRRQRIWQPRWLKWSVAISRKGALHPRRHPDRAATDRGDRRGTAGYADGHSQPRATPAGTARIVVDGVLVSGDALVTGHPLLRHARAAAAAGGVQPRPGRDCVRSLSALALLETEVLVPGHGPVWRGPIREARWQRPRPR